MANIIDDNAWEQGNKRTGIPLARLSRIGAVNSGFLERVKPEFEAWGLSQHPNASSCTGRCQCGYRYDFADLTDRDDVRLAAFGIFQKNTSLWIKGYRAGRLSSDPTDLPVIFDNTGAVFTLTRRWSIWRPMNIRFELPRKLRDDRIAEASKKLVDDVIEQLPRLRRYLYE